MALLHAGDDSQLVVFEALPHAFWYHFQLPETREALELLRTDHAFPQILKHRGAKSRDGVYFGPFASAGAVNMTLNTLQRAFLLRSCSDAVFAGRTRPCLLYQIKRCSAPCTGRIDAENYAAPPVSRWTELRPGNRRGVCGTG